MTEEKHLDWLNYHNHKPAYRYVHDPEKESQVNILLNKLTPRQREVLELHAVGRLSFAQIARMLGRSKSAMQAAYNKAIKNAQLPTKPDYRERFRPTNGQATSANQSRSYRYVGDERAMLRLSACDLYRDGLSSREIAVVLRVSVTLVNELIREGRAYKF